MDVFDSLGIAEKNIGGKIELDDSGEVKVKTEDEPQILTFNISDTERELAIKKRLIPVKFKDVRFDEDDIKERLREQSVRVRTKYIIKGFQNYIGVCTEILSSLRTKRLPRRSWVIGAPVGFGKSEFANECILTMMKSGWLAVPYISLLELASIRVAEEQRLMRPFNSERITKVYVPERQEYMTERDAYSYLNSVTPSDIVKKPTIIESAYSFSEYINAECLIVHFSGVESKEVESKMLMQLLAIRAPKGLPTIAMVSTSLDQYLNDKALSKIVWEEIMDYGNDDCYNKVKHVSCFKIAANSIADRDLDIEANTGIVE